MLATVSLISSTALATELAEAVEQARGFAEASKASNTRKAYASDLRDFNAFCDRIEANALPADPAVVAAYLAVLAKDKTVATIRRRMVAISQAHKAADVANPVEHRTVQAVLAGIIRLKTVAPIRKDALTGDRLAEVVDALGTDLKGQRDRALILLAFAGALRRSEAAALDVADVRFSRRGAVVTIRRSKTDQDGEGREIAVPYVPGHLCPATALGEWLDASGITEGAVFRSFDGGRKLTGNRIDGKDIARLVKRVTLAAGIEGDFSGHSMRAGFVTTAAQKDVSEANIQRVTGHRSVAILRSYVRRANIFEDSALATIFRGSP